jgi:hypothetical protein
MKLLIGILLCLTYTGEAASAQSSTCPVTHPNGKTFTGRPGGGNHGNDSQIVGLPSDGKIVFKRNGPGAVLEDGSLAMKFWWWRLKSGSLSITGRRLDGDAPPARANIPEGYGNTGFQSVALIFPTPGCWEITGKLGGEPLTFVVQVEDHR